MGKFPVQVGFLGCSTGICAVFAAGGGLGFIKIPIFVGWNGLQGLQMPTLETRWRFGGFVLGSPYIQATYRSIRYGL